MAFVYSGEPAWRGIASHVCRVAKVSRSRVSLSMLMAALKLRRLWTSALAALEIDLPSADLRYVSEYHPAKALLVVLASSCKKSCHVPSTEHKHLDWFAQTSSECIKTYHERSLGTSPASRDPAVLYYEASLLFVDTYANCHWIEKRMGRLNESRVCKDS